MRNIQIICARIATALVFLCVWEIIARSSKTAFFFIASPSSIAVQFVELLFHDALWFHFLVTGAEAVGGLVIGTLAGSIVGLLLWYSLIVARIARPFIVAIAAVPVFAFAPLMIVWFGIGFKMKVALAAFSTVFISLNQAYRGATLVSDELVDVLRGMGASRKDTFSKVIVPGSLVWVLSSMRLNTGFALLGAFIGEFIAADKGLGYLVLRAGSLYDIPRALAAALGLVILAIGLDTVATLVETHRNFLAQLLSVPRIARHRPGGTVR